MSVGVGLTAKTDLFSPDRIVRQFEPGVTIQAMVDDINYTPPEWAKVVCIVNDRLVPRERWSEEVPNEGDIVQINLVPLGGDNTKQAFTTIFVLAVAVVATYATGNPAVGAAVASAAGVGLAYLTAPPKPKDLEISQGSTVTGQSNQVIRDGVIPKIYGRVRVTPPHGALPFTEVAGDDLYIRMLLCPGHGPLDISDIRIGDTPIAAFGDDVEVEIREGRPTDAPLTLYSNDVFEENPGIEVTKAGGPVIRTTRPDTDEITVDLTFPNGIFRRSKSGKIKETFVQYRVEYAPAGTNAYLPFTGGGPFAHETERGGVIRVTFRAKPIASGQFDVRIIRETGDPEPTGRVTSEASWTALRSITYQDPLPYPNLAKVALRIKRDGNVDRVNMICHSYLEDYNGVGWVESLTNNPASIFRDILIGGANANPLSTTRLREDEDLVPWHTYCAAQNFDFNGVFEDEGTVDARLRAIASAGRAFFRIPDGRYGVGIDQLQTTPVAMFTPRNSKNFQGFRSHAKTLHAVRVLFVNEDEDFEEDERLVFADGFDELNADPGRIEVIDYRNSGVTNSNTIWRHGRFYLAQNILRQERWTLEIGLQSLVITRGDLVRIANDVILVGGDVPSARVKSVTSNGGGDTTSITVDDLFTMEAGNNYGIQAQVVDTSDQPQIVTAPIDFNLGPQATVTFTTPIPATQAIRPGDLVSFGIAGVETIECIVAGITPSADWTARLDLVAAAPGIHNADTGAIPPFNSNITLPGDFFGNPPDTPVIDRVFLEKVNSPVQPDTAHGETIVVVLAKASSNRQPPENYQVRLRIRGEAEFSQRHIFPGDSAQLALPPVPVDKTYELQVRALGRSPAGIPNESPFSGLVEINVPKPDSTTADIPQIVGLELFDQANNTEFSGRDPKFVWRLTAGLGSLEIENDITTAFSDPALSFYEVRILNPDRTTERRTDLIRVPEYTYRYEDNFEDAKRLNRDFGLPAIPARDFVIGIKILDTFGREGPERFLSVNNPSPATPSGLNISGGIGQIFVSATAPSDPDFVGMKVWASNQSGFIPNDQTNLVARAQQNHVTFQALSGEELFVRAAFFDVFSEDVSVLNISSEFAVSVASVDAIPDFTFEDILFTPDSPNPNEVSWTAGTANVLVGGVATPDTVVAGSAVYPGSGSLFLYYVAGSGQIFASTDPSAAAASNARVLAIYKGGATLTSGNGDVIIDGSTIAAGTIVGQAMAAGTITGDLLSGTNLIVDSAQIGNLVVETSNIADLAVNRITTNVINGPTSGFTTDNTFFTVSAANVVMEGGTVIITADFIWRYQEFGKTGNTVEFETRLLKNGTVIKTIPIDSLTFNASAADFTRKYITFREVDQVGASNVNYTVQIRYIGTHFSGNGLSVAERNLVIQEVKK